jgi:hypothetical protein
LAIIVCPVCSRKLRIPDGKRGTVNCPICSAEWFHPETIELSDIEFRCSVRNGAQFNVISSRRSPLHKFVIQKITTPTPDGQTTAADNSVAVAQQPALDTAPERMSLGGPKLGGWLSRLTGRKAVSSPATSSPDLSKETQLGEGPTTAAHSIEEYNWSGFSCPYCSASSFVSGGCGHLTCDGSVKLKEGRRFYQCFCGHAGFLTGTMKTVGGRRLSVEAEVGSRSESAELTKTEATRSEVALPRPTQSGPPAKR